MYIQTKKAIILIIFLLTVIFGFVYSELQNQNSILNILVVSEEDNLTNYTLTSTVWKEVNNLNKQKEINDNYKSINPEYIQVNNSDKLEMLLDDKIHHKDLVVIIGNKYNSKLAKVLYKHTNTKFILIDSNYNQNFSNLYKINIDWNFIINKIISKIKKENDEKIKVAYLLSDNSYEQDKYLQFIQKVNKDNEIQVIPQLTSELNMENDVKKLYAQGITNFISLDISLQEHLVDVFNKLQVDNLNAVLQEQLSQNKEETSEEDKETSEEDKETSEEDKETSEEDKEEYKPIKYYGLYSNYKEGSYDYINNGYVTSKNIFSMNFQLDFTKIIVDITVNEKAKQKQSINTDNQGIVEENIV